MTAPAPDTEPLSQAEEIGRPRSQWLFQIEALPGTSPGILLASTGSQGRPSGRGTETLNGLPHRKQGKGVCEQCSHRQFLRPWKTLMFLQLPCSGVGLGPEWGLSHRLAVQNDLTLKNSPGLSGDSQEANWRAA